MTQAKTLGAAARVGWIISVLAATMVAVTLVDNASGDKNGREMVVVETGSLEDVVTAQGKLEPKQYVDMGAQISGQLKKIHVRIGQTVKAGDLLAEIDSRVYESRVRANRARLKTLQAQRAQQEAQGVLAKQMHERNRTLIKSKAISIETLQISEATLSAAVAQLAAIDAQIEEAQSTLDGQPLRYNERDTLLNPHFLAFGDPGQEWHRLF